MEVFDVPSHYYPSDAMSLDELAYWITFNRVSGIGPVSFKSLLEYYDNDLEAAWRADTKELAQAGLTQKTIENVVKLRATSTPQRELEKLEKLRIRVITWKDKNYPPLLREIDDSPPVLYTYGKLTEADQFALAVVGTRTSTTYGRQVTERIVTDLAKGQVTIVSGLALGIDTIAHTAALTIVAFYSLYLTGAPARTPCLLGRYQNSRPAARCRPSCPGVRPYRPPVSLWRCMTGPAVCSKARPRRRQAIAHG